MARLVFTSMGVAFAHQEIFTCSSVLKLHMHQSFTTLTCSLWRGRSCAGGQESDSRKQSEGGEERIAGSHWLPKRQIHSVLPPNYVKYAL